MNIHLKGYFGHQNLGDDLLMISSYRLIKDKYPDSQVYIKSRSQYVSKLLPEIKLVNSFDELPNIDVLVYGGGGIFFDFKVGSKYFINKISTILSLKLINKFIKFLKPKSKVKIIGWGLGVGPYNKSSNRFLKDMYFLSKFNFLGVRDKESYEFCRKINNNSHEYTDIVFDKSLWIDKYEITSLEKKVSIVLREWKFYSINNDYISLADKLSEKNIKVKFLFFNPKSDKKEIEKIEKTDYETISYTPNNANQFISEINSSSLIITQRAHGAIVGNVLGCPSICIGIEPKLKNVHKMIFNSSVFLETDFNIDHLITYIENELLNKNLLKKVQFDNEINVSKIKELKRKLDKQ